MAETTIDLAPHAAQISSLLEQAVATCVKEHSEDELSLLVLDYAGFNPMVMIAADTPANSAAHVEKFPDNCGKDELGEFCNSPWDCKYQLADYLFDGFPDLYESGPRISLKMPDETVVDFDFEDGDEALHKIMLDFLLPIMESFGGYRDLNRAELFRLGVQVQNSTCSKFWSPNP